MDGLDVDPLARASSFVAAGRLAEARRLLDDLLAEAVVNGWRRTLVEVEELALQAASQADGPEWRVPLACLAAQAALAGGRPSQAGFTADGLVLATRAGSSAGAYERALELLRLDARQGGARRADAAFALRIVHRLAGAGLLGALGTGVEPRVTTPADDELWQSARAGVYRLAALRDEARFGRDAAAERVSERLAARALGRQVEAALWSAADRLLTSGLLSPPEQTLLWELLSPEDESLSSFEGLDGAGLDDEERDG